MRVSSEMVWEGLRGGSGVNGERDVVMKYLAMQLSGKDL